MEIVLKFTSQEEAETVFKKAKEHRRVTRITTGETTCRGRNTKARKI